MNSLAVDKVVISAEYEPVDTGSKIIVTVLRVSPATQHCKAFKIFSGWKGAGPVRSQHCDIKVPVLSNSSGDFVNVIFTPSEVRKESRSHYQYANWATLRRLLRTNVRRLSRIYSLKHERGK